MDPVFLFSVLSVSVLGFVLGAGLSYASKKFAVEKDSRVEEITGFLPGANCGGCGYAGCAGYADGVVFGGAATNLCAPGGPSVSQKISALLGLESVQDLRKVAFLHCAGSKEKAKNKYIYNGVKDCKMASLLGGGQKACDYGCMGYGNCVRVCKFDALSMDENGLPVVDRNKCTACGACVKECPKNLFSLLPDVTSIYLACSSHEKGKAVKDVCSVGCIGCTLCVKTVSEGIIVMKDNLPFINYDATPNLTVASYKCPTKSYLDLAPKRPYMSIDTKCKGNGKCTEVCPVKECISGESGQPHKIDPKKCIGCGLCYGVCPEKAIHVVGAMGYVDIDMLK